MKTVKIILMIVGVVVLLVLGLLGYVKYFLPGIEVKEISVDATPERASRGEYLASHVMVCMDCHSGRDWSLFSGPITPGTYGAGGDKFDRDMGFPGVFYAPNITPYHLKNWSDGEIYRAITSGVNKKGKPLFPVMPYHSYGKADMEDIFAVISYIRTLDPVENDVPPSEPDFPMGLIMNLMPQEAQHSQRPQKSDKLAYGKYMATIAACADCHTPFEKGQPLTEMAFAGGREFELPFGTLRSNNLTPHKTTGIGEWTESTWLERFRAYDSLHKLEHTNGLLEYNSLMPWNMYAGMNDEDLLAIFAYLKSLDPIENRVEKVTYNTGK